MSKHVKPLCNVTLSWDEKYPSSYVFVPSKVFMKWKEQELMLK